MKKKNVSLLGNKNEKDEKNEKKNLYIFYYTSNTNIYIFFFALFFFLFFFVKTMASTLTRPVLGWSEPCVPHTAQHNPSVELQP